VQTKHNPQPSDTKFNEKNRDWVEIYTHEMHVASTNGDYEAWNFFFYELIKEKSRIQKQLD
jgi:hypothetical protein